MTAHATIAPDEVGMTANYLVQQQDAFRNAVFGLAEDQLALTAAASALCLGGLLKHVTAVQRFWLDTALAAPGRPVDDRDDNARGEDHANQFRWLESDSLAEAMRVYDEVCAELVEAVRVLDPATAVPVPDAPWFPKDLPEWSVRWVWMHVLEELARHAGHADIIREAIDGATMFELMAGREGWPETPWLKPWRPRELA